MIKKSNNRIKRISVPFSLIKTPKQSHMLYLYVFLKTISVDNKVHVYSKKLKDILLWKDNKTIKKYLKLLKDFNYIDYSFTNLPINKPIDITISSVKGEHFTQVDIETIRNIQSIMCAYSYKKKNAETKKYEKIIEDIKERALHLFYYYETYYNDEFGYAFTPYEMIRNETGISYNYIKIINTAFNKSKLVNVSIGNKYIDEEYETTRRETNKYIPMCIRK